MGLIVVVVGQMRNIHPSSAILNFPPPPLYSITAYARKTIFIGRKWKGNEQLSHPLLPFFLLNIPHSPARLYSCVNSSGTVLAAAGGEFYVLGYYGERFLSLITFHYFCDGGKRFRLSDLICIFEKEAQRGRTRLRRWKAGNKNYFLTSKY